MLKNAANVEDRRLKYCIKYAGIVDGFIGVLSRQQKIDVYPSPEEKLKRSILANK